jgi:hypothetical protein
VSEGDFACFVDDVGADSVVVGGLSGRCCFGSGGVDRAGGGVVWV